MNASEREQYERILQQQREMVLSGAIKPLPQPEPPTIHYTELQESPADKRGAADWNLYRRIVGQLIAEGHEGRWVLIHGGELVGIWDTEEEVDRERLSRFLMQDVLMKQIRTRERLLRGWQWRSRWH